MLLKCHKIFTGTPPFAGTPESMLLAVVFDRQMRPEPPEGFDWETAGMDDRIWALMVQAWAHSPEHRPDAVEISNRLKRDANTTPSSPRSVTRNSLQTTYTESLAMSDETGSLLDSSHHFQDEPESLAPSSKRNTIHSFDADNSSMASVSRTCLAKEKKVPN